MIITTAFDEADLLVSKARQLSLETGIPYYPRRKKSLKFFLDQICSQVLVMNFRRGLSYFERTDEEVFFHPNMAFHRIKQLNSGQKDSLVTACKLEAGMTFFDGTLGLASDSLVASYVVGESGKVMSVEKSFPLFLVLKEGLSFFASQNPMWAPPIRRLNIENADNFHYLQHCESESFDVVYFDFMFNTPVPGSKGIQVISPLASRDALTKNHVIEALRVAKQRVVVKASYGDNQLKALGFEVKKTNQKRHFFYAVIEKYSE